MTFLKKASEKRQGAASRLDSKVPSPIWSFASINPLKRLLRSSLMPYATRCMSQMSTEAPRRQFLTSNGCHRSDTSTNWFSRLFGAHCDQSRFDGFRRTVRVVGGNPVLALLDVRKPKLNGLEGLKQNRSDPDLKHLRVVIVTSSREEQDLVKSCELWVNAYVAKPVGFEEFTGTIKQIGEFWAVLNEPAPLGVMP